MILSRGSSLGSERPAVVRSVLLVEDSPSQAATYAAYLSKGGYHVDHVPTGEAALSYLSSKSPDLMILDLRLPGIQGRDVLKRARRKVAGLPVIVITDYGSIDIAVDAMREGASDFVAKPFDAEQIRERVAYLLTEKENDPGKGGGEATLSQFHGFTGSSDLIRSVYRLIRRAAGSRATVFITGESGTGKELCARAIHQESARAEQPFVELNCAAIPNSLMESEIFGYEKGAFTGADSRRDGAAIRAHRGTLFLDEICDMNLELQAKLLRFIQTGRVHRIGAARPVPVDVRFVCATNRDPLEEVTQGRFREDLYYRLHVVPIALPALRERKEDILMIAESFLQETTREENKRFRSFDDAACRALLDYDWPGNVRQLQNTIRNVVVLNDGFVVTREMLPNFDAPGAATVSRPGDVTEPAPVRSLKEVEREAIERAIDACDGNIPRAAGLLGVSPSTIYRKIQTWGDRRS